MSRDPGPSSPTASTPGVLAPVVRAGTPLEAKLMVIAIVLTALALALIAGIAGYVLSHTLMTAVVWGGSVFVSVAFGVPSLVKMWFHGP
ncbi:hypothetical protein ACFZB4_42580 [Streptomyces pseudovenezuelae]|uniref:hypothetical protein n=1 Tax=Streptomyces pseudovenezuelae TaxID=67350 RepID=UPI0036E00FE5